MSKYFVRASAVLALVVLGLAPLDAAQAQDCTRERALKSMQGGGPVELSFRNASAQSRRLYWIEPAGDRKFIAVVAPGSVSFRSVVAVT